MTHGLYIVHLLPYQRRVLVARNLLRHSAFTDRRHATLFRMPSSSIVVVDLQIEFKLRL